MQEFRIKNEKGEFLKINSYRNEETSLGKYGQNAWMPEKYVNHILAAAQDPRASVELQEYGRLLASVRIQNAYHSGKKERGNYICADRLDPMEWVANINKATSFVDVENEEGSSRYNGIGPYERHWQWMAAVEKVLVKGEKDAIALKVMGSDFEPLGSKKISPRFKEVLAAERVEFSLSSEMDNQETYVIYVNQEYAGRTYKGFVDSQGNMVASMVSARLFGSLKEAEKKSKEYRSGAIVKVDMSVLSFTLMNPTSVCDDLAAAMAQREANEIEKSIKKVPIEQLEKEIEERRLQIEMQKTAELVSSEIRTAPKRRL